MIESVIRILSCWVVLTLIGSGAQGTATAEWGIYVYMGSDYGDVQVPSLDDLEEMERVGSTTDVHVVVQRDGARGAGMRRYLVQKGTARGRRPFSEPLEVRGPIDSGSAESLASFLDWSLAAYPARRRMLVLAGHSWGWMGAMQDEQEKSIIRFPTIARVLKRSIEEVGAESFDVVLFDACNTGSVEVAYELKNLTRHLVFSAMEMPYKGLPWDRILSGLSARPRQGGAELATLMVRSFVDSYAPGGAHQTGAFDPVALVAIDVARMEPVFETIRDLGHALVGDRKRPGSYPVLRRMAGLDGYLDVGEMGRALARSRKGALRDAASDLLHALGEAGSPPADEGETLVTESAAEPFTLDVTIEISATRAPRPGPVPVTEPTYTGRRGRAGVLRELIKINPELSPEDFLHPRLEVEDGKGLLKFRLKSKPSSKDRHEVSFRPYLASSTRTTLTRPGRAGRVVSYPATYFHRRGSGPVVAMGYSNGAFPWQGLGIYFVDRIEPSHIVRGPGLYRQLAWDRYARWSRFLFGSAR